jgi:hypothetical protein
MPQNRSPSAQNTERLDYTKQGAEAHNFNLEIKELKNACKSLCFHQNKRLVVTYFLLLLLK